LRGLAGLFVWPADTATANPLLKKEVLDALRTATRTSALRGFKPSPGLEPGAASLPSSNEAGTAGKRGKPRARKPRKKRESSEDE
jgi:hypothetical protein